MVRKLYLNKTARKKRKKLKDHQGFTCDSPKGLTYSMGQRLPIVDLIHRHPLPCNDGTSCCHGSPECRPVLAFLKVCLNSSQYLLEQVSYAKCAIPRGAETWPLFPHSGWLVSSWTIELQSEKTQGTRAWGKLTDRKQHIFR